MRSSRSFSFHSRPLEGMVGRSTSGRLERLSAGRPGIESHAGSEVLGPWRSRYWVLGKARAVPEESCTRTFDADESCSDSSHPCGWPPSRHAASMAFADPARSNLMSTGGRSLGFARRYQVQLFFSCLMVHWVSRTRRHPGVPVHRRHRVLAPRCSGRRRSSPQARPGGQPGAGPDYSSGATRLRQAASSMSMRATSRVPVAGERGGG